MHRLVALGLLCGLALGGCDKAADVAAKKCAAPETYADLTRLIARDAAQAAGLAGGEHVNAELALAASGESIAKIISYSLPAVEDYSRTTNKVSCTAVARIAAQTRKMSAQRNDLPINDLGPDHISYRIAYSVQPAADRDRDIIALMGARPLANIAIEASLIDVREARARADAVVARTTATAAADAPPAGAADENAAIADRYSAGFNACMEAAEGVTSAIMDCLGSEIDRQDQRLNQRYAAVMAALPPAQKTELRASERKWINYRDATCDHKSSPERGGTLAGVIYANCILDETIKRTLYLEDF